MALMPKLLIEHMKADGLLRDKAKPVAEELLSKFRLEAVRADGWSALEDFRDELEKRLKSLALEAFRQGKQSAYEVVATIPPKTKARTAEKGMNSTESRGWIDRHLEAWRLEYEGQSRAFVSQVIGHAASMKAAGIKDVGETIGRDWRQRGRLTGTWQRFVLSHAEGLIGQAEMWGQECGYHGVGQ